MIPAWLMKAVAPVFTKGFLRVVILLSFALAGLVMILMGASELKSLVSDARQSAIAERDAYWTGQIEKSNAMQARRETEQALETMRINADTAKTIADQRAKLLILEKANAALPNGTAVGLDRGRVQLLPD